MDGILAFLNLYTENILFMIAGLFFIAKSDFFGSLTAKSQMTVNKTLGIKTPEFLEQEYGSKLAKIIGVTFIGFSLFQIYQKTWA